MMQELQYMGVKKRKYKSNSLKNFQKLKIYIKKLENVGTKTNRQKCS